MTDQKELLAKTMHAANQAVLKPQLTKPTNVAIIGASVVGETLSILRSETSLWDSWPVGIRALRRRKS